MKSPQQLAPCFHDMDHVRVEDGKIYRVLGNFRLNNGGFLAYNLYSPQPGGDRSFRGIPYVKNYTEDCTFPRDVLDTYEILSPNQVVESFDPIKTAKQLDGTYDGTAWAMLYCRLTNIFGQDAIGIFGSSLPGAGLHQNPNGTIKNDIDFFIEGLENVSKLEQHLAEVREGLGFADYSDVSQQQILRSWEKVFRNQHNSLDAIMARRWSGMELKSRDKTVLNTLRFRDKNIQSPAELLDAERIVKRNVTVEGQALNTDAGNLYPRQFLIETGSDRYPLYSFWWKFSSPVKEGDRVAVCGDMLDINGQLVLRLTNYEDHWIRL